MTIFEEAELLVNGARRTEYGHPAEQFERLAKMWEGILDIPVTQTQVGLCLVALKISRLLASDKRDSLVDAAGYLRILEIIGRYVDEDQDAPAQRGDPACTSCYGSGVLPRPCAEVSKRERETCPDCRGDQ